MRLHSAKLYLRQVRRIDQDVDAKQAQIEALEALAMKVTSAPGGDRVQISSVHQDKIAGIVAKIVDLQSELNDTIDKLVDLRRDVTRAIDAVEDPDLCSLLIHRYLLYWTWERIAVDMHYTYQWVHVLHSRALEAIEKTGALDKT